MKFLAIDAGNTNIVFAVCDEEKICGQWRIESKTGRTEDEYAAWLLYLLEQEKISLGEISGAIISSVVPEENFALERFCNKYLNSEAHFIEGDLKENLGIKVTIETPRELGADRLVNSIAARDKYKLPLIILDFGTATTFDVVDKNGDYIGGVISPGINLSLKALGDTASRLHAVSIAKPEKVIGINTITAMQSGIYNGYTGLIKGIIEGIENELGEKATIVATGGLAGLYSKEQGLIDYVDNDLTIYGLQKIYKNIEITKASLNQG